MSEAKKRPKCGGEMEIGHLDGTHHWDFGEQTAFGWDMALVSGHMPVRIATTQNSVWKKEVLRHE
jgi:hypothetical protein